MQANTFEKSIFVFFARISLLFACLEILWSEIVFMCCPTFGAIEFFAKFSTQNIMISRHNLWAENGLFLPWNRKKNGRFRPSFALVTQFLNFACLFVKVDERSYGAIFFAIAVLEEEVSVTLRKKRKKHFLFWRLECKHRTVRFLLFGKFHEVFAEA